MRSVLIALVFAMSLAIAAGCNEDASMTNTQGANLQTDVGIIKFVNEANRPGISLEVITEGERRLLIVSDAEVLVQRPDFSGFSNTGLWQLGGTGRTIKYEFLLEEVAYVAPDYPEYVVRKLFIYAVGYPDMPAPTED